MEEGDRVDPIHLGHRYVEDDDVGAQLACELDGLFAVSGLSDDLEAAVVLQDHPEDPAKIRHIVYDKDSDAHSASFFGTKIVFLEHVGQPAAKQAPKLSSHVGVLALG